MTMTYAEFMASEKSHESKKSKNFFDLTQTLFSEPKGGKTTWAAAHIDGDREPYFLFSEDGYKGLEKKVQFYRVRNWGNLKSFVDGVLVPNIDDFKKNHSLIVLDLVSEMFQMCQMYVCAKAGVVHPEEMGTNGKGFSLVNSEFKGVMMKLFSLGMGVILITHLRDKAVTYNGKVGTKQMPDLPDTACNFILGKSQMVGYIMPPEDNSGKPAVRFSNSGRTSYAGSNFGFMQRDFDVDPSNFEGIKQSVADMINHFNEKVGN